MSKAESKTCDWRGTLFYISPPCKTLNDQHFHQNGFPERERERESDVPSVIKSALNAESGGLQLQLFLNLLVYGVLWVPHHIYTQPE